MNNTIKYNKKPLINDFLPEKQNAKCLNLKERKNQGTKT